MLSSLLPGVREIRTPLTSGYLWLAILWIFIGDSAPTEDPGHGPFSTMWRVGESLGRPALLAALSFAAYLVGTFLEIDPLHMWEHGGRPAWITRGRNMLRNLPFFSRLQVFPISGQAREDMTIFSEAILGSTAGDPGEVREILSNITKEESQIATRIQANNIDLYNKYDRLLAESSFRVNIAPPLTLLSLILIWSSRPSLYAQALLTIASTAYGFLLFRQGVRKAIRSRDVITQALAVGIVESTYLRRRTERANGSAPDGTN
ncbi:hypothetical protein [Streptomyces sp. NPDC002564]|uniref:hypothetical protein n=1 Tax=Streptomyces sp. NPDC002564 TaxID=3364649 RepID=UPI0036A2E514